MAPLAMSLNMVLTGICFCPDPARVRRFKMGDRRRLPGLWPDMLHRFRQAASLRSLQLRGITNFDSVCGRGSGWRLIVEVLWDWRAACHAQA